MKDTVEIIDIYNQEGFWVKRTINDVPIFIPKQDIPSIKIINLDTEWIMQKSYMTKEEFRLKYPELLTKNPPEDLSQDLINNK